MGFSVRDSNDVKLSLAGRAWCWARQLPEKLVAKVVGVATMANKLARDDPRRVVHSFKVGLAITLVSLFYYFQPLYKSFGVSAMWAVMTVVVVFEFTVGATLGKGFNRAMATLIAGGLGVGAHHLANLCGKIGEPVLIGLFVYIFAAVSTFMRFFPKIKARYDYGFLIFILTFSFISISGYRADEILELAHKRLTTIAIGGSVSLLINSLIFPVWAGEELHNSIALNMEKLGLFLEGFGAKYLKTTEDETNNSKDGNNKSSFQGYKSVLNSKNVEENMKPQKFQEEIREACTKISLESSKTLKKLGSCIRATTYPSSSVNAHIVSSKAAVKSLTCFLTSSSSIYTTQNSDELLQIIPIATIASLLIDIVDCTEKIAECTYDLAILAHFEKVNPKPENNNQVSDIVDNQCPEIVITIAELALITSVNPVDDGNFTVGNSDSQHSSDD
ncbi:hypothetical protein SOVF_019110 [Spinacia oleracea]|nr:hypothetical protein SOVF_019110 [Spinacia oleracea]